VLGLKPGIEPIWVCGSTGPGEEAIVLRAYRRLLARFPRLRLVIVPRHPERFDEVDQLIMDSKFFSVRLSLIQTEPPPVDPPIPPVILVDAMGVLRDFYSIADVVFVGRSLVDLGPRQHGSDMIEPAALGKPVIVGPFTGNFAEVMSAFRAGDAILEAQNEESLEQGIAVMLSTPAEAIALGKRASAIVTAEQGATLRHARLIAQIVSVKREEATATPQGQWGDLNAPPPPENFGGVFSTARIRTDQ